MKLVNLTPHTISLYSPNGVDNIAASGQLARVRYTSQTIGELNSLPVVRVVYGDIDGLPAPQNDTAYIVSQVILTALKDLGSTRTDVFAPATGPNDGAVRNQNNQVMGVTRLVTL